MKILVFFLNRADHAPSIKIEHVVNDLEGAGVKAGLLPSLLYEHCCSVTQYLSYTLKDFS
jgi:hypothetical protein